MDCRGNAVSAHVRPDAFALYAALFFIVEFTDGAPLCLYIDFQALL